MFNESDQQSIREMHEDQMNTEKDITIHIDQTPSEEHFHLDNQQDENSNKSKQVRKQINTAKKIPMTPTRLEYSWWSTHPNEIAVIASVSFTVLIIIIGTMIVCLTQPISDKECKFVVTSLARDSNINDSRPHSIAIGDFNNDGLPDIVVPNSGMNNIGIFLRHANSTFADQITYSTGSDSTPYAVATTDFNHDQQLDIAVANFGSHTIGIFLGVGNGTFRPQISFSTGSSRPRSIAIGDFNNDTRIDIAVVNYATNSLGIFLQDTNESFTNQTVFSTGYDSDPYSLVVGDLNNDHQLDIAVVNYGTDNVGVFLRHGNATFGNQTIFSTGLNCHPSSIAIGNLNNDTYLDIAVACFGTNSVGVLMGNGDGTFPVPTMYSTGKNSMSHSIAIADLDSDKKLDIVVANYGNDSVIVLLGDGNGYFSDQNQAFYQSSHLNPYSIAIEDFNGDNRSDIAVVNYDFNYVDIILNWKNYGIHDQSTYSTSHQSYPLSVVITDLNNDNHRDILVANSRDYNIMIFLGYGDGTFSDGTFYSTGVGSGPSSVAVGDFNNDKQLDIVVANYQACTIGVFLGYGNGSFSTQTIFPTGTDSHPFALAVGDLDNDDQLDIVVANSGSDNFGIFLGCGNGTFNNQIIYSTGTASGPISIAIDDLNNDSQLDIVVANIGTNNVGVFLGYGDGIFSNQIIYFTGYDSQPSSIAVGDFDSDDRSDIIVTNSGTNIISLFLGYGNGTFSSQFTTFSTGSNSGPWSIAIGDFNNDSRIDVAVGNYWTGNLDVFFGYGNGSFSNQITYSTGIGSQPSSVSVGDLNDDGHADIAVADHGTSSISVFIGYENGSLDIEQTITTTSPSHPRSVAVGDFNDDDRLDIAVANSWIDNVRIFLGDGNGTFSSQTIYDTSYMSSPWSIAVGDFNNDSRLDIVVANSGTSNIGVFLGYGNGTFSTQTTFSTGKNSQPAAVAVGDFNNDGELDIAVANWKTRNIGIFLGYGDGTFQSQVIYSTHSHSEPCSIAVGDFDNDSRLDIVITDCLIGNIGVFKGYGDGTFSSQTIYPTTRGSLPTNAAVGDLNNDGQLDIVVSLELGPGILVSLGNGNGTFSRPLIYSIGSHSEPSACALGDMNNDHWLDVIVTDFINGDIVILLGDGDGSFSKRRSHSTSIDSYSVSIAFRDFNNDRILDTVVANWATSTIGVFLGFIYINGERESVCSTGSSPHPRAVALGDFNKDNQLDIVIVNYGSNNLGVLSQDINRTFPIQTMFSTGALSLPTSVAVDDLNNDNELDITVANSGTGNIGVLYGYGNGSFKSQTTFSPGFNFIPQSLAIGDFNNDNRLDIVVADSGRNSIMTLLRYDSGVFGNQTNLSTGTNSFPMLVAVGDLNHDNWLDFVVANGDSDNVGVFLGLGNATFSNQTTYSTGSLSFPRCIAVADLNKDSHLDIIVCNYWNNTIGIFLGFHDGTFSNQTTYPTGYNSGPAAIAIDDLNNDSWLDIVVANYLDDNIGVFLANDDGNFFSLINYSTGDGSQPCSVTVGDFNNDNQVDIVVVNLNSKDLGIFIGYGNGAFSTMISCTTGSRSGPISVIAGDFNNDGRLDIAVANSAIDNIGVLFGYGNGTFSDQTTYSTASDSTPYFLATGDFNNDNQLDIVVANVGSNSFSVLLGCTNGTFFAPLNYFIADGSHPFSIAVGDFNNDHRPDVIVTDPYINTVNVFVGYASETFLFAPPYSTGSLSQPASIAVGDFDHDNRLDVVVANYGTDNIMILFGSGYGTFTGQKTYFTGDDSKPCSLAIGDFNNDNRLDVVVANSGTNNIGIFLNKGSGIFSSRMTYSTGLDSQPYSVVVLNFDNDTQLDIAVANYVSNNVIVFFGFGNGSFTMTDQSTYDTGFASHPYALAAGDINNDNQSDIVIANDGYGNIDIILKEC